MRKGAQSGFTLIELLVVIVILGILAGVVVFSVGGVTNKGETAAHATDARTLRTAQEAYFAKFGRYATADELVEAGFLSSPPELSDIVLAPDKKSFTITCDATNPGCGSSGAVALGGTLVINNGATAPGVMLNPAITSEGGTHSNSEDMFNGLLRYEKDGSIGGDLAQSFSFDTVPSSSNPNCPPVTASTCDANTTVATFVLREGVKFHNGTTLTPADVEFSFEKAILAAHGRTRAIIGTLGVTGSGLSTVTPPEAIQTSAATTGNGGTVKFNLRQVFAPLRFTLNVTEAPIISKSAYEPCWNNGTLFTVGNACPANVSPVGTGPFKFESLNGTTGITTVKNPDYFRFENGIRLPYLDKVIKKIVSGNSADSLKSGAVDVAGVSNADRPSLADAKFVLTSTPRGSGGGNCITTISFNTTKRGAGAATTAPAPPGGTAAIGQSPANGGYPADSPYFGQNKPGSNENARPHRVLGDSRVREAIFKALDRAKFHQDVAFGAGRVADAPVHSIFQPNGAYQGAQPLPGFDRAAAGALLSAAGWSDTSNGDGFRRALNHPNENDPDPDLAVADGTKLALEYLASTGNEAFATEVKSQLATVGIDVTPVHGNNASFVAPRLFRARTYDMGQISYCNNDEPQFGVRRQYHTDQLVQTDAFTNASGYKSTMMDQLWVDASKAPDTATYQLKFLAIQRLALGLGTPAAGITPGALEIAQKIPMVQMLESAGTRGHLAVCQGFNHNNTGLYFESAYCAR
jgi:peptide/nickel transport system substrate-binding protein